MLEKLSISDILILVGIALIAWQMTWLAAIGVASLTLGGDTNTFEHLNAKLDKLFPKE